MPGARTGALQPPNLGSHFFARLLIKKSDVVWAVIQDFEGLKCKAQLFEFDPPFLAPRMLWTTVVGEVLGRLGL